MTKFISYLAIQQTCSYLGTELVAVIFRPILFRKEFPTEKKAHLSAMDLEHRISKCLPGKLIPLLENWSNDLCVYDSASIRCPNCGAPIEDGKCCVYCGQII